MVFVPSVLATTAAAVTIAAALVGVLTFTYRAVRRVEANLGVDKHGRTQSDRLERIEHQLWPNGGSSLADIVHRTSESTTELRAEVRVTRDLMSRILERH